MPYTRKHSSFVGKDQNNDYNGKMTKILERFRSVVGSGWERGVDHKRINGAPGARAHTRGGGKWGGGRTWETFLNPAQ